MKIIIRIIGLLAFLTLAASSQSITDSYNPEKWESYIIDFSDEGTLTDLYDTGIRPYHFPGLERTSLEFKHARLSFNLDKGGVTPEIASEWVNVSVLQDGLLASLEISSSKLTVDQARSLMGAYLLNGSRTAEDLENYLEAVQADYRGFNNAPSKYEDRFRIRWDDKDGPSYTVFFKQTFDENRPLSLGLKLGWAKYRGAREMRKRYSSPIPPPEGYSGVSMDAPEKFGPDSNVDMKLAKGLDIGDGSGSIFKYQTDELDVDSFKHHVNLKKKAVKQRKKRLLISEP